MKTLKYGLVVGVVLSVSDCKLLNAQHAATLNGASIYRPLDQKDKKLLIAKLALNKRTANSQGVSEDQLSEEEIQPTCSRIEKVESDVKRVLPTNKPVLESRKNLEGDQAGSYYLSKTVFPKSNHMSVEPDNNSSEYSCKWALPVTIDCAVADQGFDCNSRRVPLSKALFGRSFTFMDIDLFTRLCYDSKVHIQNNVNQPQGNRTVPVGPSAPFGQYRDDLYPTLLATTQVSISASQKETQAVLSIIRRQIALCWGITGMFGMTIPIKYKSNTMDLSLYDGKIFSQIFSPTQTVRENAGFQFFKDYESVYDYFVRVIVGSKGLIFEPNQTKLGFGDINLFAVGDFACLSQHLDSWQIGVNLVCPSGGRYKGDKVWELVLGNGGAWQFEAFTNAIMTTPMWFLNPALRLSCQMSIPFKSNFRIPKVISNASAGTNTEVKDTPGLIAPANFAGYYVSPFAATDSTIPWFAESASCTRIRWGSRVLFGIGNYIYDLFCSKSRLGLFYDFAYKACDKYVVEPVFGSTQVYNTASITGLTKEKMHRLGWNWTYTFNTCGELTIGSQHVIAGMNMPKTNDIFVTWTMVF